MRHTDAKVQLQAVCSQWLPLAQAVLGTFATTLEASFVIFIMFPTMCGKWVY